MATKPEQVDWRTDDDTDAIVPPSTGKRNVGWLSGEKPPYQYVNWFFRLVDKWLKFFEKTVDLYDVVIGSGEDATHATLVAAVADSGVGTNVTVLIRESFTGPATAVSLSKAGWKIHCRPGVTFTKHASATTGLSIAAANVEVHGLRFAGFSTAGNKAVAFTIAGSYGRVVNCNFVSADTEVDDDSVVAKPFVFGSISE